VKGLKIATPNPSRDLSLTYEGTAQHHTKQVCNKKRFILLRFLQHTAE